MPSQPTVKQKAKETVIQKINYCFSAQGFTSGQRSGKSLQSIRRLFEGLYRVMTAW